MHNCDKRQAMNLRYKGKIVEKWGFCDKGRFTVKHKFCGKTQVCDKTMNLR